MSPPVRRFPKLMPLLRVAREILKVDKQQAYMLANKGLIDGAFKVDTRWFVHVPTMIKAMQTMQRMQRMQKPTAALRPDQEEGDPLEGLLDR